MKKINEFEEIIESMSYVSEYDGEKVMNTVLDHYYHLTDEKLKNKRKVHKFLLMNEELRNLTEKQKKIIEYCKSHKKIFSNEVEKLLEYNQKKEEIIKKALKMFGVKIH